MFESKLYGIDWVLSFAWASPLANETRQTMIYNGLVGLTVMSIRGPFLRNECNRGSHERGYENNKPAKWKRK